MGKARTSEDGGQYFKKTKMKTKTFWGVKNKFCKKYTYKNIYFWGIFKNLWSFT
jgi:hypothetical protein